MNAKVVRLRRTFLGALASLVGVLAWRAGPARATAPAASSIGNASLVVGNVALSRDGQQSSTLVQDARLFEGDRVETSHDGELHISFDDGGYIALRPNSALRIDQYVVTGASTDSATLKLLRGALRSVTGWIGKLEPNRYSLAATTVFVGVRGTDHEVIIVPPEEAAPGMDAGVHDRVNEGGTTLRNDKGTIDIAPGAAAYAPGSGAAPRAHVGVPGFFDQRHTQHEQAAVAHAQNIRQHMEERLRARGKLRAGEGFDDFRKRQPTRPQGLGNGQDHPGSAGQRGQREPLQREARQHPRPNAAHAPDRSLEREAPARREARQAQVGERLHERQEAAASRRRESLEHEGRERRR